MPGRIRLCFPYPPPIDRCNTKFMFSFEKDKCDTIHDLQNLIKYRFRFLPDTPLHLEIDSFILLPFERTIILKDDDVVTVCLMTKRQKKMKQKRKAQEQAAEHTDDDLRQPKERVVFSQETLSSPELSSEETRATDFSRASREVFKKVLECDGYRSSAPEDVKDLKAWLKSGIRNLTKKHNDSISKGVEAADKEEAQNGLSHQALNYCHTREVDMRSPEDSFRVKLEFDSVPPAMPISSKYMILVKPGTCETICDLEQLIIRKFGFYRGATVLLSVDGFTLLSTEDIHILSNNDCLSVCVLQSDLIQLRKKRKSAIKQERMSKIAKVDGQCERKSTKKQTTQITIASNSALTNPKKRKQSTSSEDPSDNNTSEKNSNLKKANSSSAKICKGTLKSTNDTVTQDCAPLPKNSKLSPSLLNRKSKNPVPNVKISDPTSKQVVPVTAASPAMSAPTRSKKGTNKSTPQACSKSVNGQKNHHITFDSSSSDSSSSETDDEVKKCDVDANLTKSPTEPKSLNKWLQSANSSAKPTSHQSIKQYKSNKSPGVCTNVSTVFQNPSKTAENVEKSTATSRNYSELLPSTWPPRVGDTIAYKILEMSHDYTPIITEYKEAKVVEVHLKSSSPIGVNAVKIEHLWPQERNIKREGGRFEMDFSDDENSNSNKELILEWKSLLEPKRIE